MLAEAERPLVGGTDVNGVIDPDVIWSCTNCGACVEECPVDIEHIDHIDGMRRHQVLIESAFPAEASTLLKNLENKGNPWGMGEAKRADWITECDFDIPVVDGTIAEDIEYLFWVGCAGALEDRAKKTTKAIAELLYTAGVKFAVLGPAETCTGDPARRMGNEFVYSMLAQANVETLDEAGLSKPGKTIVASCPHCFNTIANEYPQLGGNYQVIHHTQLLAKLVEAGQLKPVTPVQEKITYHDPCFLGRHNKVYTPPREIIERRPRHPGRGDAPVQEPRILLRRGRRADVDGRAHRQADQHRAHRRGPRAQPRYRFHRMPLLPGDARRRGSRQEGLRGGQGKPRSRRCGAAAGPFGQVERRQGRGRRSSRNSVRRRPRRGRHLSGGRKADDFRERDGRRTGDRARGRRAKALISTRGCFPAIAPQAGSDRPGHPPRFRAGRAGRTARDRRLVEDQAAAP